MLNYEYYEMMLILITIMCNSLKFLDILFTYFFLHERYVDAMFMVFPDNVIISNGLRLA